MLRTLSSPKAVQVHPSQLVYEDVAHPVNDVVSHEENHMEEDSFYFEMFGQHDFDDQMRCQKCHIKCPDNQSCQIF